MKRAYLLIPAVLLISALLGSCELFGAESVLIGTWSADFEENDENYRISHTWEFRTDGTALDILTFKADPDSFVTAGTDTITYAYTVNFGTISFTYMSQESNTGRVFNEENFEKTYFIFFDQLSLISPEWSRTYTRQ